MFDHIFENRDKKVTNIIKLSDYLGRSLRENVEVFSIDDSEKKVTFITEQGQIIAGNYDFDNSVSLTNIQVESGDLFEDNQQFDDFVNYKISNFIENIFEEDFVEADTSFSKVLQLWESRVKFTSVKKKLYEKSQKFNGTNRIIESDEFQRLIEIAPQLVTFLKENTNLVNIPEISNMIKLSSSVSEAFDLPRLNYDALQESTYTIPEGVNHTIYEMICKQELVRKELVESKNNFDLVWLNNQKISNLASLVYERDESVIAKALVESICEVPYLALATKKQITDTVTNNLELNESIKVNLKDIKSFSSLLFEYKKPLKSLFISMLNEKYGISVQNLKDIPTFKSLLNTQVLIFEALAKLSPKGSVAKEILTENSQMLKTKNGVECIDVNHFIELLFERAGYSDILDQETLLDTISIKETFSNMDSVEELVDIILEKTKKKKKGFPDLNKDGKVTKADVLVGRGVIKAETEVEEEEPRVEEEETPEVEAPEQEKADESPPDEEKEEDLEEKTKEVPTSDEIMSSFKNFEDILNSIDFDSLEGDENEEEEEESEEASEEEAEVDKKEEGEE
jgi:hypothetical protein|tara:strand:- start:1459 stop:3165 length:1707 start_codon:yes stop_codon:yes gene_type:complete